ncbi:hypothetical protein PFISCL1PPCAC_8767, partial [Pristionchus fissidentatus]
FFVFSVPAMNFKAFTGGGGGDSSTSFAAAKALFEAAKKPENRALAAKNPVIRNAAVSAAQNPQARQAMISAASTYGANQNAASSTPVLKPEPVPKPPAKDYGGSTSYGSSAPSYGNSAPSYGTTPRPTPAAAKPVYPDIMSELRSLNIGRDNEPAPTYSTPAPPAAPAWKPPAQPAYHPPAQPAYQPPQQLPVLPAAQRQDWTKFSDAPARPPPPKNIPLTPKSTSPTTEAYAVVKYPHAGSHFDELTCVAGDRIVLKREVDEQWIYGLNQRTGKFGIVPIAFVDVKVPLVPSPSVPKQTSFSAVSSMGSSGVGSPSAHMATALYDYFSDEAGDLSFSSGASIKILERVGTDWLSGEIHGRRGIFPSNFVNCPTLSSVPQQLASAAAPAAGYGSSGGGSGYGSRETLTATYDYNSGVAGDLVFFTGDVIDVVERLPDGEWIRGRVRGATGLAPLTYLSSSPAHSAVAAAPAAAATSRFPSGTPCVPPLTVTALADHHTADPDCLYFSAGDQLIVTEVVDNEWAKGKLAEFKKLPAGYFPRSYVR